MTKPHPGFRSLDRELTDRRLPVEGTIPSWLSGRLVRNGPGRFEVGDDVVDHWFDGLAMLRRYEFADGEVRYTNRFPRTGAYAGAAAGEATGGFSTGERGLAKVAGWLRRLGPPEPTDNANVHVARIDGDLAALTEVPRWIGLDDSLGSRGEIRFRDDLELDTTTAHLCRDSRRGELVGFGLSFGRTHEYVVYRIADGGRRREVIARVPTDAPAYIHDCAITEEHVVLVESPLRIAVLRALSPLTGSFLDMLDWRPESGARFLLVDRATGDVETAPAPPRFTFHTVNAFREDGETVVDLVDFPDDGIVDGLGLDRLRRGAFDGAPAGRLVRHRIDVGDGGTDGGARVESERLFDGGVELPSVPPVARARPYRYAYAQSTDRPGANGLVKLDVRSGTAREWWERGVYVEEPRVVRRPGADAEDDGVVLAPALDVEAERTSLLMFDAATLEVLARARVPHAEPLGFHGRFFPG